MISGDYTLTDASSNPVTTSVTIPASSASTTVTFGAVDDTEAEADNTLTLALAADAGYTLGATTSGTATIPANDFGVTNTNDSGDGSLRQALINANALSGTDTITFTATGTIQLASPLPTISTNLSIAGPGAALLTVRRNAGGDYSVLRVNSGVTVGLFPA